MVCFLTCTLSDLRRCEMCPCYCLKLYFHKICVHHLFEEALTICNCNLCQVAHGVPKCVHISTDYVKMGQLASSILRAPLGAALTFVEICQDTLLSCLQASACVHAPESSYFYHTSFPERHLSAACSICVLCLVCAMSKEWCNASVCLSSRRFPVSPMLKTHGRTFDQQGVFKYPWSLHYGQ